MVWETLLAENNLGFMEDGGDERLPRFLSRAVALSKGCIGHGFRLHGQRRVSSYYYWDSHDIQPHRIRFSPRHIAPSGPLKTCLLTYLSQTKEKRKERKTELVRSELHSTSSFLLRPLTPVCWIVSENSDVTPPFFIITHCDGASIHTSEINIFCAEYNARMPAARGAHDSSVIISYLIKLDQGRGAGLVEDSLADWWNATKCRRGDESTTLVTCEKKTF
ncbi:hypothetical protein J3E68DRAFT_75625 [Trichoderma sp. SZMC 28012]